LGWLEYTLTESGVTIREKDIKGIRETTIEYDQVGREATYYLRRSVTALLALILFALFSAITAAVYYMHGDAERYAWVFWLALTLITLPFYVATRQKGFRLQSDFSTVLILGNARKTSEFLSILMKRKLEFIEKRAQQYLSMMDRADVDKYLLGLRDGSALTNEQYESIRERTGLTYQPKAGMSFRIQ
jgi:hypothetical protein